MRAEDRVAIHEAMEQQTISIAKAGISTVLNCRVAVLAVANPPSGRYDDAHNSEENIDLQTTILSRFDLVYLMRDERLDERDIKIAHHVCSIHRHSSNSLFVKNSEISLTFSEEFFKRRKYSKNLK